VELLQGLQKGLRRYLVLRGVSSTVVGVRGHLVHHYALEGTGTGPPVVLVHGLGGNAGGFSRIFFGLAKRFRRVLAVDLPGNGFSPLPEGGPLPLQSQFGVLVDFCQTVVREPAFVVGNSLGGAMSVMLAHGFPQLVRALGLISPAGAHVDEKRLADTLAGLQVHNSAEARALLRRLFHRAPLPALILAPEIKKLYGRPAVRALFAELAKGAASSLDPSFLRALEMPTLLIWGQSEKLLPFEGIDFFKAHLPPHARVQIVKGFGHVPQVERPRELTRRLLAFADDEKL